MRLTREHRTPPGIPLAAALLLVAGLLLLALSMERGLNHDEHQFVASGALLAREGLLPYRDYPYFHVPYLTFVYAALFSVYPHLLAGARLVSVAAGWLTLATLFAAALRLFRPRPPLLRLAVGAGALLLLLAHPLLRYTSGRAWNHDLPVLLLLLALLAFGRAAACGTRAGWLLLAGTLLGLATGTRLSFAAAVPPFALAALLLPNRSPRERAREGVALAGGVLLGLLPALASFALAPKQALFGNLGYIRLNTLYYREALGQQAAMSPGGKLAFAASVLLQPASLPLLVATGAALVGAARSPTRPTAPGEDAVFRLVGLLLPFLLAGALAATPPQVQYFYVLVPFLVLALLHALARLPAPSRWPWVLAGAAVAVTALLALPDYAGAARALAAGERFPARLERDAAHLARWVGAGRVLTLAPILPLEGGLPSYPALATGAFAWRIAPLLPEAERRALGLLSGAELLATLETQPPRALLVGLDNDDAAEEAPLVAFARERGYVPWPLPDAGTLWLQPQVVWGDRIRYAALALPSEPPEAGGRGVLTLLLQAVAPIERDLNVLVRLVALDGSERWRDEGWPFGSPTSRWPVGEVWADGHEFALPPDLPPGPYAVEVSFYDPATLAPLPAEDARTGDPLGERVAVGLLTVGARRPAAPLAPPATFGTALRLLGATREPTTPLAPGDTLRLRLFWQALASDEPRTVFVHLVGPDGQLVAQHDRPPLGGLVPPRWWQAEQIVADPYRFRLPADAPPGTYRLLVGLYDPATGQRLPATRGGAPAGDAVEVGRVEVAR